MPVSKLDNAPRCRHVKMNGDPCAAPARRGADYCVFHAGAHGKPDLTLRMVEDAMSLQYALFQVIRLLAEKEVDTKRAALMLYALQIASANLRHLREETSGIANRHDIEREKSFFQEFLEVLKLPPNEAELAVEEFDRIADGKPARDPNQLFDIQACAAHRSPRCLQRRYQVLFTCQGWRPVKILFACQGLPAGSARSLCMEHRKC